MKLDWNDISIVPAIISDISSRSEIDPYHLDKLPLFTAPMDTVIDDSNIENFVENNINICLPRHIKYENLKKTDVNYNDYFYSFGIDEIIDMFRSGEELPNKVLIDVANGHMKKLLDISKEIKDKYGDNLKLMVGNIANPKTYLEYCRVGVDYIRVGIGGGSSCTTSANTSIHYPMASLINECYGLKKDYETTYGCEGTKIIADGGFRNYSDIIKAISLGADYVMLGGVLNKTLESCGDNFILASSGRSNIVEHIKIDKEEATIKFKEGTKIYKNYRGMSTKEVQRSWNKQVLKTSEGISKMNLVESTLQGWSENFTDYLKSAMSYTGKRNLKEFIGEVHFIQISDMAFNRFNK